jgi:hypothetical protein
MVALLLSFLQSLGFVVYKLQQVLWNKFCFQHGAVWVCLFFFFPLFLSRFFTCFVEANSTRPTTRQQQQQ